MNRWSKFLSGVVALACWASTPSFAQPTGQPPHAAVNPDGERGRSRPTAIPIRDKLNAWTVGIAGGLLEGAPIRFATEIARIADDGDNMLVLPIVTRGPVQNVEALLYLRGVDVAIINSDALDQFTTIVPDIQKRISYLLNLFPSEFHVLVRPEINSLGDLRGKKVNFNTPGTAAAYSGPLVFDQLQLDVHKTFLPHPVALEQMKAGTDDMAAVVFVTTKPVDLISKARLGPGFRLLPIPYSDTLKYYLPSTLTAQDYPQLIQGGAVETIAVPTVLAAFNWPRSSDRYKRVARLTEYLFSRIDQLQKPGFHPKWADVNLRAEVPGLNRFPAAQEWLDRSLPGTTAGNVTLSPFEAREMVRAAAPNSKREQERLFREFLDWQRSRQR
jgi:TRAP-type uncharacterized transport system substrate-binding protein